MSEALYKKEEVCSRCGSAISRWQIRYHFVCEICGKKLTICRICKNNAFSDEGEGVRCIEHIGAKHEDH